MSVEHECVLCTVIIHPGDRCLYIYTPKKDSRMCMGCDSFVKAMVPSTYLGNH